MATGHNVSFHLGFPHENITLAEASLQNLQTSIFTPSNYNQNFQDRLQCQCSVPTVCCRSAVYMIHHLKSWTFLVKKSLCKPFWVQKFPCRKQIASGLAGRRSPNLIGNTPALRPLTSWKVPPWSWWSGRGRPPNGGEHRDKLQAIGFGGHPFYRQTQCQELAEGKT